MLKAECGVPHVAGVLKSEWCATGGRCAES